VQVLVYQPQVKSWRFYRGLVADTAISVTENGGKPRLGVISWKADTIADVSTKTVLVSNIEVVSSRFPSLDPAQESVMQVRVREFASSIPRGHSRSVWKG